MILYHGSRMKIPTITQENIRVLLPVKIAKIVQDIVNADNKTPLEALTLFYQSETYALLEKEKTKYWWMSAPQLFAIYQEEQADNATNS